LAYSWSKNEYVEISSYKPAEVRPKEMLCIRSLEYVELPNIICARVYPNPAILPLSILNTPIHVEPGYEGNLRVSLVNLGSRSVVLEYGMPFCRIEFERLSKPVKTPRMSSYQDSNPKFSPISKLLERRTLKEKHLESSPFVEGEMKFFGEPFDLIHRLITRCTQEISKVKDDLKLLREEFEAFKLKPRDISRMMSREKKLESEFRILVAIAASVGTIFVGIVGGIIVYYLTR
jgi:dUTPase